MNSSPTAIRTGFSLVELSIVLVILGLLVGGVLSGQSLIQAAQLRTVVTEHDRWIAATHTFRDKYFALPGDMTNATAFWGTLSGTTCPLAETAPANTTTGVCDGDGDGQITRGSTAATEVFQFWKHLANAGMIEGNYTGIYGSGTSGSIGKTDTVPGSNSPQPKFSGAAWFVGNISGPTSSYGASGFAYQVDYQNTLIFGGTTPGTAPFNSILKPEDAWNIDTKMDDGMPGTGKVIAHEFQGIGFGGQPTACTTSTSGTDYSGKYNLANANVACSFWFANAF
jgi:prepilin-type N-terminal cleavage/methylation domain-containing protein